MNGVVAYALAKNIAASAVSGVKNYIVDGTTLKIETNDGNVLEMAFPVPTGIDKGYYNDENGKFYRDSEFENEIIGKTDVVYIDYGKNRLCFWDGEKFDAIGGDSVSPEDVITNYSDLENKPKIAGVTLTGNKSLSDLGIQGVESGKGLSTNDYTNEEKAKLAGLSNYNDSALSNRVTDIESNKVDKVEGKGLSTNDYTDKEKTKLAGLSNYDDTSISNRVSNLEGIVPNSASSSNKLATLEDIPNGPNGTTNYNSLENKPQIAGTELSGNKTLSELGIQPAEQGKGLSTEDYTTEEKTKLAGLTNYDDSVLTGKVADIEKVIPSSVTEDNKLATLADIPEGGSTYDDTELSNRVTNLENIVPSTATIENKLATIRDIPEVEKLDYNTLSSLIVKDPTESSEEIKVGENYILGEGAKGKNNVDIQVKCLSINGDNAIMQTYGITAEAWPGAGDLTETYSSYWGELSTAISGVKLPTLSSSLVDFPIGSFDILVSAANNWKLFGSNIDQGTSWTGTTDENGYIHIVRANGNWNRHSGSYPSFVVAPYFILYLPKVLNDEGIIKLNPNYKKLDATDLVTKIETKINNRYTKDEVDTVLNNKVDKVNGKGLSTEDFTTEEKNKLTELSNYDDSELDTRVSSIEEVMPTSATPSNPLATLADIPSNVSGGSSTPTNYATLSNKPQIAGVELTGNKTLANLGIQPAEEGKGLSTNDFSDADKSKLDSLSNYDDTVLDNRVSNVENALSDKVDKDGNKGLSTNDFTTEDKAKLDGLSNYDDTEISSRVQELEDIIPESVSNENKLATIKDINDIPIITLSDIDRLWGVTFEDGDREEY